MDVPQTGGHVLVFPPRPDKSWRQKWGGVPFLEIQQRQPSEPHRREEGQGEHDRNKK